MFNSSQFKKFILKPSLELLQIYSEDAFELMLFTCAAESKGGTYLYEMNGSGIGIYCMQPQIYNDLWQNYINYNLVIKLKFLHSFNAPRMQDEDRMIYDLNYATAMAWMVYNRLKGILPKWQSVDEIWEYYNKHYNSRKIQKPEAVKAYFEFT